LGAQVAPDEVAQAMRLLPPGGVTLFLQLPVDAQRHSLNVLGALARQGTLGDDLAAAALLHDCGKMAASGRISLWTRGPLVLLEVLAPQVATRLARPIPSGGWRHALWVQQEHAAIGADWARQVGCSETTCWLIAHHQDRLPPAQAGEAERISLLRRLQRADSSN
jgi:hypothetical protein